LKQLDYILAAFFAPRWIDVLFY